MNKKQFQYFIGIDIAAQTFAASIFVDPETPVLTQENFENTTQGFFEFEHWLNEQHVSKQNSLFCLEACGIYSEAFAHYFYAAEYTVCLEHALKVKKAFKLSEHKTDAVDSKQIAEYAFRFTDQLLSWQPRSAIMEKIQHIVTAREQFIKQRTALQNELTAYKRHIVQVKLIITTHEKHIKDLTKSIKLLEKELTKMIDHDDTIRHQTLLLKSAPGFGLLLSTVMLITQHQLGESVSYKTISSYLGLCPFKYESGTSVKKRAKSRGYGPSIARKLLRLAAQSAVTHNENYRYYYQRKLAEGKAKALVLNNVANKMIKVACALLKNNKPYIQNYVSINPNNIKVA